MSWGPGSVAAVVVMWGAAVPVRGAGNCANDHDGAAADRRRVTGDASRCLERDESPATRHAAYSGARRSVRIRGPLSVIATVCSAWAAREPSFVMRVQPSGAAW